QTGILFALGAKPLNPPEGPPARSKFLPNPAPPGAGPPVGSEWCRCIPGRKIKQIADALCRAVALEVGGLPGSGDFQALPRTCEIMLQLGNQIIRTIVVDIILATAEENVQPGLRAEPVRDQEAAGSHDFEDAHVEIAVQTAVERDLGCFVDACRHWRRSLPNNQRQSGLRDRLEQSAPTRMKFPGLADKNDLWLTPLIEWLREIADVR